MIDFCKHINKKRISKHTLFWFIWISSFTVLQSLGMGISDYGAWLLYYLVTLPLFMAHTYVIAYWLVPKYFFQHRYLIFACWIFALLILASVGELLISNELIWKLVKPQYIQQGNYLNPSNILINGLGNEYIIIVFLSIKAFWFWDSKMGEKASLTDQKLSTEIELLQNQFYPRFVLNVMERLEILARDKSSQTSEMIIRLSGMMSNLASRPKSDKIPLYKEIELIKGYLDVQKMSFQENLKIKVRVNGSPGGHQIPQFLFFQLVEEAFYTLGDFYEKAEFTILLKPEPQCLTFSMNLWSEKPLSKQFNHTTIENCGKYLEYFYPESHKIISIFEINFVEITLEIYS